MRYKKKKRKIGETRIISKFLFLPLMVGVEWRWLERASFKQKTIPYHRLMNPSGYQPIDINEKTILYVWENVEWID